MHRSGSLFSTLQAASAWPILGYGAVWAAAVATYVGVFQASAGLPIISFAILGVVLPGLAFAITWTVRVAATEVAKPRLALLIALAYLGLFSAVILGWGFGELRALVQQPRPQEVLQLGLKVATMIVAPLALMGRAERHALFGIHPQTAASRVVVLTVLLGSACFAISASATGALPQLRALSFSAGDMAVLAGCIVWVGVGAAFSEETLFRAYLQPRLAAILGGELWAVPVGALLFALAHVPGLYLRADQAALMHDGAPSLLACIVYAIAVLSPPGILFGVLWARTRNLIVVIIVHTLIDLPPSLAGFTHLWR